jgi:hypothetical protein
MDVSRIASRVAELMPLSELLQQAKALRAETTNLELAEVLDEVIEKCNQNSSDAYLLMQDFTEIAEEAEWARAHGKSASKR